MRTDAAAGQRRPTCQVESHTEPFFRAAAAGRLLLPWCRDCGRYALPGSLTCSGCWGENLEWRRASGRGRVHTFVVFRRSFHPAFDTPYNVCIVELSEGPRLLAEAVGIPGELLHVGMDVVAEFPEHHDGRPPVRFRPAHPRGGWTRTSDTGGRK